MKQKTLAQLSVLLFSLTTATSTSTAAAALSSTARRSVRAPRITATLLQSFVDSAMRVAYRTLPPGLQPGGHGYLIGAIQQDTKAFLYIGYALKHPKDACIGAISLPLFYIGESWYEATVSSGLSCLSRQAPVTFGYYSTSFLANISVEYARALSNIQVLRVMHRNRAYTVPMRHGFYIAFASCTDLRRVQGLNTQGQVLYDQQMQPCSQP